MDINPDLLEKLAEAAHNVWMEGKLRDGWKLGTAIDKEKKTHTCLVPYDQLSETDRESDRDMVRGIPRIVELAGDRLVKKDRKIL